MTYAPYQTAGSIHRDRVMDGSVMLMPTFYGAEPAVPMSGRSIMSESSSTYVPGNAGMTIRTDTAFLTGDTVVDNYRPRTELGRKLLALRRAYVTTGGQLLDGAALDAEVQLRRGGVADA